ncbi:MAG: DUF1134 domain-containing protein [Alphaproteobacteria bacterium]|nr:DUF1134 domain-containing protein [Alphaproteobacteria bacterium]
MTESNLSRRTILAGVCATTALTVLPIQAFAQAGKEDGATFSKNEIMQKAEGFFGKTTKGLAEVIEKAFADHGRPNAIITGSEAGGAFVVGARFGEGHVERKNGGGRKLFWQGPSAGFDFGGNASKVFTLIYHLGNIDDLYQRFPGVDGSLYIVAGLGLNYQQSGKIVLAPIRTGVGLRAGANVGYVHYTREHSWVPL